MRIIFILLPILALIGVPAYGQPVNEVVGLTLPTDGQIVYEDLQITAAIKTNISVKISVYFEGVLAMTNSVDQGKFAGSTNITMTVPVSKPGTNTLRVEVWQTGTIAGGLGQEPWGSDEALLLARTVIVIREYRLNAAGWIFLIFGWGAIISLGIFSYARIFGIRKEKIVEPLEIDTGDEK
ncbi:MAG: hypothetical protein HPY53_03275 [Brevinematales bacterium]|nr:hypothetical protein [Brevinematales bacterium]